MPLELPPAAGVEVGGTVLMESGETRARESRSELGRRPSDPGWKGGKGRGLIGALNYLAGKGCNAFSFLAYNAAGDGFEYYFGYTLPQNDLNCEDWRSRDRSWGYCRVALELFEDNKIPFWRMRCADELVGNPENDNSDYCLASPGEVYVVYLPEGGTTGLDLGSNKAPFQIQWYNPRSSGPLLAGSVKQARGPGTAPLGDRPEVGKKIGLSWSGARAYLKMCWANRYRLLAHSVLSWACESTL